MKKWQYDPSSTDFFAMSFETKQIQKTTQRAANAIDIDSISIARGRETPHWALSVFTVQFS